jgi:hypothetical protein
VSKGAQKVKELWRASRASFEMRTLVAKKINDPQFFWCFWLEHLKDEEGLERSPKRKRKRKRKRGKIKKRVKNYFIAKVF